MLVPTVGSKVKITLRDHHGPKMIPPRSGITEYEGTVLNPDKWLTDRQFCLSGSARVPVRIIDMTRVVDIKVISGKLSEVNTSVKTWNVNGSKGNKYVVTRTSKGWSCTCTGYQFRKQCKHITELSKTNA
jgi:hypothetical protein